MSSAVGGRGSKMSPALIGAITVLILVITTFLAYNSNRGLPWVPSKSLTVEVGNAANIVPGNEVRIGGTRVGIVEAQRPNRRPDGSITALLELKLDQTTQDLPVDTNVLIRARSLLGLKYVQLTPGTADEKVEWGSTLPLENAQPEPVELDELLNTFDEPTREGVVTNTVEFGNAFAGRGPVIAKLIDDAAPLAERFLPVGELFADEENGLVPVIEALAAFTGELAASGDATGGLFRGLDRTLGAIARADAALDETLQVAPTALDATARSLAATRGAVEPHILLARDLQPAFSATARGAANLAAASEAGLRGLPGVPRFARDFDDVLDELDRVSKSPVVAQGLDGVTNFMTVATPLVTGFDQLQRTCGYASMLLNNIASATTAGDNVGTWVRAVPLVPFYSPNSEIVPASSPLNGAGTLPAGAFAKYSPSDAERQRAAVANSAFLYSNPAPRTGQGGVCQPGYEVRPPATQGGQQLTIGARSLESGGPYITAPPKGSDWRPASLDAEEDE